MTFLEDLLEVKYTLSQWYINNSDFDNIEEKKSPKAPEPPIPEKTM